jgi:hypothetical protein
VRAKREVLMPDGTPPTPPGSRPSAPSESPYRTPGAESVAQGPETSGLAIAGFILALIPLACVNIVGVILGIVALVKISAQPRVLDVWVITDANDLTNVVNDIEE